MTNSERHAQGVPCTVDAAHHLARVLTVIRDQAGAMPDVRQIAATLNRARWPGLGAPTRFSDTELHVIVAGAQLDLGLIGA